MRFFGLYKINGLNDRTYYMTAKQIYKRILKDSQSENDWIVSVAEILRICEENDFPKDYAEKIKICILKYFANIEIYKKEKPKCHMQNGTNIAVKNCYNSIMYSTNKDVISARKKYFCALLDNVIDNFRSIQIPADFKPTYKKVCKNWKENMIEKYFDDNPIKNIERMKNLFKMELFDAVIKALNKEKFKQTDDNSRIYTGDKNYQIQVEKDRLEI